MTGYAQEIALAHDRREIAKTTAVVIMTSLVIIAAALLLWKIRTVLVLVFASALLVVFLSDLGNWIAAKTEAPRSVAVVFSVFLIATVVFGGVWLLGSTIAAQFSQLS